MEKKLRDLLENVPRSYPDFVNFVFSHTKDDEDSMQKMIDFITDNPEAKSDDVLDYFEELGLLESIPDAEGCPYILDEDND